MAVLTHDELGRPFAKLTSSRQTIALCDASPHTTELEIQVITLELAHYRSTVTTKRAADA